MTVTAAEPPWPGEELVSRVAGGTDREAFFESGRQSVRDLNRALSFLGKSVEDYETILEFGCGCGRIMLWLEHVGAKASLHGTDIDERAIKWAQENMPYATFKVNGGMPPLDYPDATFDLVYNHSVFTHLDEEYQDAWLAELRRVTKPGGTILLTVHGDDALRYYEELSANAGGDSTWLRNEVRNKGIAFIRQDSWLGGPFPDFYHSTFHAPWYLFERWGANLRIKAYLASSSLGFQDHVLMERPPADEPVRPVGGRPAPAVEQVPAPAPIDAPPAMVVAAALAQSVPDVESPTDLGQVGRLSRRIVLRALAHYDEHQRKVHTALLQAIREVHQTAAAHVHHEAASEGLNL
ncbi:MAG TPA: class I SAM-dependent methyltransferase, partial [Acidimicrobiales bacterium]|nr:class I SAM-dependent methyltransferase [Acidimicrobiales bacterium]